MPSEPRITGALSLDSLRRQLEVYETALHQGGYNEWLDGDDAPSIPIMKSLRSPTTRALTAIQENKESMWIVQREIESAIAEGAAIRELVAEAEDLQKEPILSHFKGAVAGELHADVGSVGRVPSTLGKRPVEDVTKSSGVVVGDDGAITFTDPVTGEQDRPVILAPGEEPQRMEGLDMEQHIVSQVVFAMPRDAAGNMLELMPSAILSRVSKVPGRSVIEDRTIKARREVVADNSKFSGDVPLASALVDPSLKPSQFSLKELLQQQRDLESAHATKEDTYNQDMTKYDTWQTKRMGLLDGLTNMGSDVQ